MIRELSNYPDGAEHDPDAPWNQMDEEPEPKWFRVEIENLDVWANDADEALDLINELHKKKHFSVDGAKVIPDE